MNHKPTFIFVIFLLTLATVQSIDYKDCVSKAFNVTCKSELYACLNSSDCSYQLHENTKHIILTP